MKERDKQMATGDFSSSARKMRKEKNRRDEKKRKREGGQKRKKSVESERTHETCSMEKNKRRSMICVSCKRVSFVFILFFCLVQKAITNRGRRRRKRWRRWIQWRKKNETEKPNMKLNQTRRRKEMTHLNHPTTFLSSVCLSLSFP